MKISDFVKILKIKIKNMRRKLIKTYRNIEKNLI